MINGIFCGTRFIKSWYPVAKSSIYYSDYCHGTGSNTAVQPHWKRAPRKLVMKRFFQQYCMFESVQQKT